MTDDGLKLTTYFGERDTVGGRFVADALVEVYARHRLQASLVLRGAAGFGLGHHLRTDRLLTLSEDLPMVSVAVDARARIEAALGDVERLGLGGLITLERARLLGGRPEAEVPGDLRGETKLTLYLGRRERVGATPAYEAVVAMLRERGIAGATVLLGVDGTAHGARRRATFFSRNAQVPLMVVAVGDGQRIAGVLPELSAVADRPTATLERVRVCKRDGELLAEPLRLPEADTSGLGVWQKLVVYTGEQVRHEGRPLSSELVQRLRRAGAAGATTLRGIWGYHGDHAPHGDSFWQLRRRVPAVTVIVDTPERSRRWFAVVDELTRETGLVTSEMVPAFRATAGDVARGGLRLAQRLP